MLTRIYQSDKDRRRRPTTIVLHGARLKKLRLSLGLTQSQVAASIGCTKAFVGHLEAERAMPSVQTAEALRDLFGVALHDARALIIVVD
jgi:transcriptional regulator with XRE-family HTH domain